METKLQKQMAIMVDAVQPHCDEPIVAAMTCSHAGSMGSTLLSKFMGGAGAPGKSCDLPNPVFIAVGAGTVYAFAYKPRGFKFKIKKEAARWPLDKVSVEVEEATTMVTFIMTVAPDQSYPLEVPVAFGGRDLVDVFLNSFVRVF